MADVVGSSKVLQVIAGTAFSYLLVQLTTSLYHAFFGPLSRIPGPKLSASTILVNLYHIWRGDELNYVRQLHGEYGHTVRLAPNLVSFNTSTAWKDLYGHKKPASQKDPGFYDMEPLAGVQSIVNADDANHARVRRIISHSFSNKALKDQEGVIQTWVDVLVRKLHEHAEKHPDDATDLVKRWNCATFDIMADLTFAESLGMLEGGEYSPWVQTIYGGLKTGTRFRCLFTLPVIGKIVRKALEFDPRARKAEFEHLNYSKERVDRRMNRTDLSHPDLWTEVTARGEKYGLSMDEMYSNSRVFMIAGTETNASLLSAVSFFLMKNPETYAKLTEEIRGSFPDRRDMSLENLEGLPYLNACLEEALRLYPPLPVGLPRVAPPEGMTVDGVFLPGGTVAYVSPISTCLSPDNFVRPDEYRPERWLPGNEEYARDNKAASQPFSTGPRNCIGKNLAYHEARTLLANVLREFDFELDPRSANWYGDQKVYAMWEKLPLWTKLRPVKA